MANWWGGHFGICGCLPEFWPFYMLTGPVMYPGLVWYLHLAHYNGLGGPRKKVLKPIIMGCELRARG